MLSLGFQQVLTMFPATVLVAILTKFDIGVTLLASGLGTIIALFVSRRRIPMYYGSSFSYIAVVITVMSLYASDCFADPAAFYCPEGVAWSRSASRNWRPGDPDRSADHAGWQGRAGQGAAAGDHRQHGDRDRHRTGRRSARNGQRTLAHCLPHVGRHGPSRCTCRTRACWACCRSCWGPSWATWWRWPWAWSTLTRGEAAWLRVPNITLPAFSDPTRWALIVSIALIAIATIPESTAHLYQMSLYIDALAKELQGGR